MPDIFKGRIIHVKTQNIKFPDGHTSLYECVYHKPAVMIIPVLENNKLLMEKQYRPVIKKSIWEFPAGLVEKGETCRQAALRELEEETGLQAKKLTKIGVYYSSPGFTDEKTTFFLAKNFQKTKQKLDPDEDLILKAFSYRELQTRLKKNQFIDLKTAAGILMI